MMRHTLKKWLVTLFVAVAVLVVAPSVLPNNAGVQTVEAAVKISSQKATIIKGESKTLKISGTSKTVKWSSSNKTVATVSEKGKVTAKKKGTAKITAKVGGKKYICKVTVENPKINKTSATIAKGDTLKLKISGTSQTVKWSSSKKSVAKVDSSGKVTAKKTGTATIKATVGGKKKYSCKVTVKQVGAISADSTSITMKDNASSKKVNITLAGASSRGCSISYSIGDTSIVSCSWGNWSGDTIPLKITPQKMGTTKIKIKSTLSSKTCSIKVTVTSSITMEMPDTPVTINNYSYSGAIKQACRVENVYYTAERSGDEYYYEIYADGIKTYDSSGSHYSQSVSIGYKIYNSNGSVVDSGTIRTAALSTGESFEGAWTNGFLNSGDYTLVLLNVK